MPAYECATCNAVIRTLVCPHCHTTHYERDQFTDWVRCACNPTRRIDLSELVCPFCHTADVHCKMPGTLPQCQMCHHTLGADKVPYLHPNGLQIRCLRRGLWVSLHGTCHCFLKYNVRNVYPKFLRR